MSLLMDFYELTMAQSYFVYRRNTSATFDLFVRKLPPNRNYLIACGLSDIIEYIKNLKFSLQDLKYLKQLNIFSGDFLAYLSSFRFSGDIFAMREGEVFFANEPVIRVTANIIEAQIIESFLLNTMNLQTMIASKASRVVSSAKEGQVFDFSLRRTHGTDAGLKAARSSYIAGAAGTSCVLAGKIYGIPISGTIAHSYVMAFKEELDSFLAYAETFPKKTILLIDTYDSKKGIENAITAGLYLKAKGYKLLGLRIDSGDLARLSCYARKALDSAGLGYVRIFASGNLDEFKIEALLKKNAKIDSFGVGTNMGTSIDAPVLDVIYKISEVTDEYQRFIPTMKLSKNKVTYPGRKQVYRVRGKGGKIIKDILGYENEKIRGMPLLIKVVARGKVVYRPPGLGRVRAYLKRNLALFPKDMKKINKKFEFPLIISPGLKKARKVLINKISKING